VVKHKNTPDYSVSLITGMNPKASFGNIPQQAAGYYTLRFAGLFNLPIPICFAFGIGVSQYQNCFTLLFAKIFNYDK
jgi:hypothetical protein